MLKQVQGVPRVLINLAHQVSPHDLVMGGISPESPSSTEALLVRPPCHGWDLPCWFLAQSKLFIEGKKLKPLSCVWLFVTPRTVVYQASPSIGFSRQKYWSGLPLPSSEDLPDPGIKPGSPALQAAALPSEPPGKSKNTGVGSLSLLPNVFHDFGYTATLGQAQREMTRLSLHIWWTEKEGIFTFEGWLSFYHWVSHFPSFHMYLWTVFTPVHRACNE